MKASSSLITFNIRSGATDGNDFPAVAKGESI